MGKEDDPFLFGKPYVQGRAVSFREGSWTKMISGLRVEGIEKMPNFALQELSCNSAPAYLEVHPS